MDLVFFKATWGMSGDLPQQLHIIREAGFQGFEAVIDGDPHPYRSLSQEHGLKFIAIDLPLNGDDVRAALDRALEAGAVLLNLQSGKDWWSLSQAVPFLEEVERIQETSPIPICHETHRGRLFFNPASTIELINRVPSVKLTADFSHWTCVCESLLDDQQEAVAKAIERVYHVHTRAGHEEGPQVSDPRAPEFARQLERFTGWWQQMVDSARRRGLESLSIDPEFGPPNYMPTKPYSREPLADLWEVCLWMRNHLKQNLT